MKKLCLFLVSVFLIPLLLVGCSNETKLNNYKISGMYDEETHQLSCSQEVLYVNNSDNALKELCFYFYANAFAEGQKTVSGSYSNKAYPNGESYGNITFSSIKIENVDVEYKIEEPLANILTISLPRDLFPCEEIAICMNYTIQLANINHRLGYGNNTVNFGNFFPIACVYQNGFVKNGYATNGDPFYSDLANFDVTISYAEKFMMASTGIQLNTKTESEHKITTCKAQKVRDFCFVLSDKFQMKSKTVGKVTVEYFYYEDERSDEHLETSVEAVKTFENLFGEYPYQKLSVVKTNFCFGGMEYPNLVMISDDISDNEMINYVIVHEIAHQWWYGVVGNNEYEEAWVDEGLTEFSTALFFENNPKYNVKYETIMENAKTTYKKFVEIYTKINGDVDESMNRDLSEFDTEPEYVNCTYTKGMLLFDSLRMTMSERKFQKCLREYYKNFAFKNSSSEDLIKSFCKTSGINLESYFKAWIEGNVYLN